MSDPVTLATLTPLVFGLVAALRKEWPTLDGRGVYVAAMLFAFAAALLSSPVAIDLTTLRPVGWLAFQVGAGAIALAAGIGYAADKFTGPSTPPPASAPPAPPSASVASAASTALALCLVLGLGLMTLAVALEGCSSAQQAEEKAIATEVEKSPVTPLLESQIKCVIATYKAGIEDVPGIAGNCGPVLLTDATKLLMAKPDAGGAGGAGGGK